MLCYPKGFQYKINAFRLTRCMFVFLRTLSAECGSGFYGSVGGMLYKVRSKPNPKFILIPSCIDR